MLESAADEDGTIRPFEGDTAIFITPGYRFRVVDRLLTNFHLPKSTLLMLVCAEPTDTEAVAEKLIAKMLKLRIFSDEAGKMNRSVQDIGGGLLLVSQFTLAADTSGGNRPSFTGAAPADG